MFVSGEILGLCTSLGAVLFGAALAIYVSEKKRNPSAQHQDLAMLVVVGFVIVVMELSLGVAEALRGPVHIHAGRLRRIVGFCYCGFVCIRNVSHK